MRAARENDEISELTATEARRCHVCWKKQVTTPEQYPLPSTVACNQKTNRRTGDEPGCEQEAASKMLDNPVNATFAYGQLVSNANKYEQRL